MTERSRRKPAFKPSRYNHVTAALMPGRYLIFNGITGALVELSEAEYSDAETLLDQGCEGSDGALFQRLRWAGCLHPAALDELSVVKRWRAEVGDAERAQPLTLTIAPTIQCNFRCVYCFEEHRQEFMPEAVERRVRAFAKDKLDARPPSVSVTWFGGEPLLYLACIERLQSYIDGLCAAREIPCSKAMITNGSLLTPKNLDRLTALGDWTYLQITIDGPAAAHDRLRPLRSGGGSWQRIIENLRSTLDRGLPVSIRMNTSRDNIDQIDGTIAELFDQQILPRASFYLGRVFDCTPQTALVAGDVLTAEEFAQAQLKVLEALPAAGLPSRLSLPRPRRGPICTADNRNGFVVGPSGLLFKCWNEVHMGAEQSVGDLMAAAHPRAEENLRSWIQYDAFRHDACESCKALPNCMGGCPWMARMDGADRGNCGQFKSFPLEMIQIAHAEKSMAKGLAPRRL